MDSGLAPSARPGMTGVCFPLPVAWSCQQRLGLKRYCHETITRPSTGTGRREADMAENGGTGPKGPRCIAVVVCEADEKKVPQLQLILRELEEQNIPRFLFLNKIDKADKRVRETIRLLQPASRVPLVLRQIPIWSGEIVIGFVDLALERAHIYKEHAASEVVPLEGENVDREKEARFTMLESLADHDDELMEQLLDDIPPPRDKIFDDLAKELRDGLICPVLIGSATRTNGVLRLMKALRHEAPAIADTVERLGAAASGDAIAYVMKTLHTTHGGKISIARVLAGSIGEGAMGMGTSGTADR